MKKHAYKFIILFLAVFALAGFAYGYSGTANVVVEGNYIEAGPTQMEASVGAIPGTDVYSDMVFYGTSDFQVITYKKKQTTYAPTATSTTRTLTLDESGTTFLLSASGTAITLPSVTSAAGVFYRFQVAGDLEIDNVVISVASTTIEDIEGTLNVAGAVVDCADETAVNFVVDGENIGDFFEISSDGTNWLLGASAALTASKLTCTGG